MRESWAPVLIALLIVVTLLMMGIKAKSSVVSTADFSPAGSAHGPVGIVTG
jgi:hypothetical protein